MVKDESEQWLLDGDCNKCRKQKYCSKECKRSRVNFEQAVHDYIMQRTGMGRIMMNIIDSMNRR